MTTSRAQVAADIAAEVVMWKRRALSHGSCIPAMWLDRGFVIRCHSWLDDRWGGGDWWIVEKLVFDPCMFWDDVRTKFYGYIRITMRAERNGIEMGWDAIRAQHDLIELLQPRICSPMQWRLRAAT